MMAANRVGKTWGVGGFETALHLTGLYPDWWTGRRFDKPIEAWAAGDTSETTRDIVQATLMGALGQLGTGLIPADQIIGEPTKRAGVSGAMDTARIRHVAGFDNLLGFKSYDQGRKKFQGTAKHLVWLDEEPPENVYDECVMRLMTTNGLMLCTFTPLEGLTQIALRYMPHMAPGKADDDAGAFGEDKSEPDGPPPALGASRFCVQADWNDVPHLTEEAKKKLWDSIPPYQRDARTKGVPALGAGAIYPVPESDVACDPFDLPKHWPRAYALDVGWKRTAALWGAWDRENDIVYLYNEYYRGQAEPSIHAAAIKARGLWIPGVIDPASRGRSQKDGSQLLEDYRTLGLDLTPALNAVEAGILDVWERLSTGRLKAFRTLQNWLSEYRIYRRDKKGRVVKENDHLMDDTRYLVLSGLDVAITEPVKQRARVHSSQRSHWGV